VFGQGEPTILLLPTWTLIHSRFWKMQVPYLSRHHRVVTYDGPGNGRSDRVTDPDRYSPDSYAEDAVTVLDESGVEEAVVVGLSRGAQYGLRLAALHPDRVLGLALLGPALPIAPPAPGRDMIEERFWGPYPDPPEDWDRYNVAYWHDQYRDFIEFFIGMGFSEPHSTKPIEDAIGWALETTPEVLEVDARRPSLNLTWEEAIAAARCPILVIHGTSDRIQWHGAGVELARLGSGALATLEGSGHFPNIRDPVRVNLMLRDFVESVRT
jgi:pimeloyl-ACP methyl ester carboxylesterase